LPDHVLRPAPTVADRNGEGQSERLRASAR
jgi:hypothetical protein